MNLTQFFNATFVNTLALAYEYTDGNYPYCSICRKGQVPTATNVVATVAGVATNVGCDTLEKLANLGYVHPRCCHPLRLFYEDTCKCRNPEQTCN